MIAFVARYLESGDMPAHDQRAVERVLAAFDRDTQLILRAQAMPSDERAAWLQQQTGHTWSAAWLAHAERQAFIALRRALHRAGLLRA